MKLKGKKIAFCLTNVSYTFQKTIIEIKNIKNEGAEIIPLMQTNIIQTEEISNWIGEIEKICGRKIINNREEAEKIKADIITITPCSGTYIKKIANSTYDTPILINVQKHLQDNIPIVLRNNSKRCIKQKCGKHR